MKRASQQCDVQSCFLCSKCMPEWRPAIAGKKENRKYKKGQQIFGEGEPLTGLFFIYQGKVKIHKQWGEKELIVRFAKAGDMIGYRGLAHEMEYPVTATALETVVVCYVDLPFFEATLKVDHSLTYELMRFYANELHDAERRMRDLVHMEVKGRVAQTLLMLKNTFGVNKQGYIDITLTRQDMASYAGTTYETFSRVANEFLHEKSIKTSGKNIKLIKENRLMELAHAQQ